MAGLDQGHRARPTPRGPAQRPSAVRSENVRTVYPARSSRTSRSILSRSSSNRHGSHSVRRGSRSKRVPTNEQSEGLRFYVCKPHRSHPLATVDPLVGVLFRLVTEHVCSLILNESGIRSGRGIDRPVDPPSPSRCRMLQRGRHRAGAWFVSNTGVVPSGHVRSEHGLTAADSDPTNRRSPFENPRYDLSHVGWKHLA